MRLKLLRQRNHFIGGGAFEVEDRCDGCGESCNVVVLNVASVFPQVGSDAISARPLAEERSQHGIGFVTAPSLTDRGHVVDVHVEALVRRCKGTRHGGALLTGVEVVQMRGTLIALGLLFIAGCSPPSTRGAPAGSANTSVAAGARTSKTAVEGFLAAVKNQDLQAMSMIWGTEKGLARDQMSRDELEKRLVIMQCNLTHDSWKYATGLDGTTRAGEEDLRIELRQKNLKAQTVVTTVQGPGARWFVKNVDLTRLSDFCH